MQLDEAKYSKKIAAMVSGGIDSMVMLDMLIKSGADVFVVHVDHGIREESGSDCAFVENFCLDKGIRFIKHKFDIPAMAKESGRSIETEARLARRSIASELINSGCKVALAHHADDNAETVLMHILRGSGPDGLQGIKETESILRPLLAYTREQIGEYAAINNVPYVTDKTNFDVTYTRNFIRLEVLPLIKSRYPGAVQALNRLALNMTETIEALDSQLDLSLIESGEECVKLSLEALSSPLAARYVITAAKKLMPVDVTRVQIQSVLGLASSDTGSKAELANGLKAYRDNGCITFCFDNRVDEFCLPFKEGVTQIGDLIVTVSRTEPKPIKGKTVLSLPLPDGCVFRNRREGDRFIPYGGKSKSLKKYLIEKKIPARLRDELVCVCNGSEVLAIIGIEISDKVKITKESNSAYIMEVRKRI